MTSRKRSDCASLMPQCTVKRTKLRPSSANGGQKTEPKTPRAAQKSRRAAVRAASPVTIERICLLA